MRGLPKVNEHMEGFLSIDGIRETVRLKEVGRDSLWPVRFLQKTTARDIGSFLMFMALLSASHWR